LVGCGWELDHCDLTEAGYEDAVRKKTDEVYRKFKAWSGPEAEQTAAASRIPLSRTSSPGVQVHLPTPALG